MIGEKTFGVRVNGIYPKRVEKYGPVINIGSIGESKRKKERNLKIRYDKKLIEREYSNGKIPPLVEDFINIALATFCADKIVVRDIAVGSKKIENRYFTRKINLVIPVSDTKIWTGLQHKLEKTISFMTYDLFRFKFIKREADETELSSKESRYDSVSLFSGGLDSFAGSYFLILQGHTPIFVSINHTNMGNILSDLYHILPEESTREIIVKNRDISSQEYTQFSRSFVYLVFATSIAMAHKNIKKIFIPENGIIARQIGLKDGRYGTKTAHPQFLIYFNELINSIFPSHQVSIENPFSYKTKMEVIKEIINTQKIEKTISCGHTFDLTFIKKDVGKIEKPTHCGMCIPCLIRTISLISSELPNGEKMLKVYFNPFSEIDFTNLRNIANENERIMKRRYRDGLVNFLDIIRLAFEIRNHSSEEIASIYPEFLDENVYELYKRFSQEVFKTIEYYSNKNPTLKTISERFSG